MANKKISELTEILSIATDDILAIVDTSENETKKVSVGDLFASYVPYTGASEDVDLGSQDIQSTGVATFGSTHQAILGNDVGGYAGFFNSASYSAYLVDENNGYAGNFTDGINTVYIADGSNGIDINGGYITFGYNGGGQSFFGDGGGNYVYFHDGNAAINILGNMMLNGYFVDGGGYIAFDPQYRIMYGFDGATQSAGFEDRVLYADDGSTPQLDWSDSSNPTISDGTYPSSGDCVGSITIVGGRITDIQGVNFPV